jgi:hypothetical protein
MYGLLSQIVRSSKRARVSQQALTRGLARGRREAPVQRTWQREVQTPVRHSVQASRRMLLQESMSQEV